MLTRMIEQRLVLAVLSGWDQIPDEALDLVITFVVSQAVNQQSPAEEKKYFSIHLLIFSFLISEARCLVRFYCESFRAFSKFWWLTEKGFSYLQITSMSRSARCHLNRPWFKMSFHRPQLEEKTQFRVSSRPTVNRHVFEMQENLETNQ